MIRTRSVNLSTEVITCKHTVTSLEPSDCAPARGFEARFPNLETHPLAPRAVLRGRSEIAAPDGFPVLHVSHKGE